MRNRLLAILALLAPLSACAPPPVDDVARRVFDQLDRADDKAIYDEASNTFQKAPGGADGFIATMVYNRRKLGRCQAATKRGNFRALPTSYGLVSVQDYTRICANGVANIEVSTVVRDGQPRLIGLHFTSPVLEARAPLSAKPQ